MMKFEYQYDDNSPRIVVELPDPDAGIEEIFTYFENFLLASTFPKQSIEEYVREWAEEIKGM